MTKGAGKTARNKSRKAEYDETKYSMPIMVPSGRQMPPTVLSQFFAVGLHWMNRKTDMEKIRAWPTKARPQRRTEVCRPEIGCVRYNSTRKHDPPKKTQGTLY